MAHGAKITFVGLDGSRSPEPPPPGERENGSKSSPLIFVSYSHEDKPLVARLVTHLRVLETHGLARIFCDLRIKGGHRWRDEIETAIDQASLAIILVSADALNSPFVIHLEVPRILEREKKGLLVIPVLLRPCSWQVCSWLIDRQILMDPSESALSLGTPEDVEAHFAALALQILDLLQEAPQPDPPSATAEEGIPDVEIAPIRTANVLKKDRFRRKGLALAMARAELEHRTELTSGRMRGYGRTPLVRGDIWDVSRPASPGEHSPPQP